MSTCTPEQSERPRPSPAEIERLVCGNLGLVGYVARRYVPAAALTFMGEDLLAAGRVGLVRAANSFDPDRGVRFVTYAFTAIRREILRAWLCEGGTIFLPPTLNGDDRTAFRERFRTQSLTLPDADGRAVDVADHRTEASKDGLEADDAGKVREALRCLTPRQRSLIERRFWGGETLSALAASYGVSVGRVGQIEAQALEKLRRHFERTSLKAG